MKNTATSNSGFLSKSFFATGWQNAVAREYQTTSSVATVVSDTDGAAQILNFLGELAEPIRSIGDGNQRYENVPAVSVVNEVILKINDKPIEMQTEYFGEYLRMRVWNAYSRLEIDILFIKDTVGHFIANTNRGQIKLTDPASVNQLALTASTLFMVLTEARRAALKSYDLRTNNNSQALQNGSRNSRYKKDDNVQSSDPCSKEKGVHQVTHDLLCTIPDELVVALSYVLIHIPKDGKFDVWVPTLGMQEVDVLDCCKKHDIALWCSRTRTNFELGDIRTAQNADNAVINCVFAKVYDAFTRGSFIEDIVNVAYFTVFDLWLFTIITNLTWASALAHKPSLLNLDGRNSNSCLCGGWEPTVLCNDKCRDLCREFGKKQNCASDCYYDCTYDKNGRSNPEYLRRLISPTGLSCCPADVKPCKQPKPCVSQNCTDCKYYCIPCNMGNWKDPNCTTGMKKVYGIPPGSGGQFKGACCPERTTPSGPGSQARSEHFECPRVELPNRNDGDATRKLKDVGRPFGP